jgi:hypothetical protein
MRSANPPRIFVAALVGLATLAFFVTSAMADYEQVGNFGESGNGKQLSSAEGMAVNVDGAGGVEPGSVYVSGGDRISRYSPTGEIEEVWGWSTIESGPDMPNGVQSLTVKATSGMYRLTATTARGKGKFAEGSNLVSISNLVTEGRSRNFGTFRVGDEVQSATSNQLPAPVPPGTIITAVNGETLELSAAAEHSYEAGLRGIETTSPVQATAAANEVKEALISLEGFGPGDISVSGGPGDSEGSAPYQVTVEGVYANHRFVPTIDAASISLAGGSPSSSVAVTTVFDPSAPRFERCRPATGDICAPQLQIGNRVHEEGIGNFNGPPAVAIDQNTGNVYVRNRSGFTGRSHNLIEVFSADGSEVIAHFGDAGAENETIEQGPEKLHTNHGSITYGLAVDASGTVYLADFVGETTSEMRVMCFRPQSPGDYTHYVYCGRGQDVPVHSSWFLELVALDDAGHLYIGGQESITELSLANPAAPPLCTYSTRAQAKGITVNPATGEVFYFVGSSDRSVHRLKPCDPVKGKFEEAQTSIKVSPSTKGIAAMAVSPNFAWGSGRPEGVLYAADSEIHKSGTSEIWGIGDILAPAEEHNPPVIESESVTNTRTGSAVLHAEIDPHRHGTRYAFQYLSEAEYEANPASERFAGAKEAPAGGGEISGSTVGHPSLAISGLSPDTAYIFRVVATNECNGHGAEICVAEGEPFAFSTSPLYPVGLPDHRAYELVSPAQKHGGEVIPVNPDIGSCGGDCKPNSLGRNFPILSAPSGDALAYEGQPFNPFEGVTDYDSYVARRTASGWETTALTPAFPPDLVRQTAFDPNLEHGLLSVGSSEKFGLQANLELQSTREPGSTTPLLTEGLHYRSIGGQNNGFSLAYGGHSADLSRLFFAANDSLTTETMFAPEPPDPGLSKNDLYEWSNGRLTVVNVLPGNEAVAAGASFASLSPDAHAVSSDGSVVFFKDQAGTLYARENGEATREIADPGGFLSASPDGSEVLLSDGCLYSLETESCSDLTGGGGGFRGLVGQSSDLSRIYFVDTAVLSANQGAGLDAKGNPQFSEAGKDNLYEWGKGETHFVAQLTANDNASGASFDRGLSDWTSNPSLRTAEASPSGRFLAFGSQGPLTGQANVGCLGPCGQVFLYDSATRRLNCASCNPTGEPPIDHTVLPRRQGQAEDLSQLHYLTDEGRLYFDTRNSLASRDTNEGVEDVYEFTPAGAGAEGTCLRATGCAFLMSAGTGTTDSNLIAIDENGKNVFFDTRDQLTLKDRDELVDIYDAREGGGIAAETEVARTECQGESCQPPVAPPLDPTPASSSFAGAGNVTEAKRPKQNHKRHKRRHKRHHARDAKRNHGGAK